MYLRGVSTPPKFGSELLGSKGPGFGSLDQKRTSCAFVGTAVLSKKFPLEKRFARSSRGVG